VNRPLTACLGHVVHALDEAESTQLALAGLAAAGAPEGTVVMARHQRAGRGRRGHSWWDAPGQSLLFSVLLRPPIPLADAPQLSLVAGLAVAEGLDAVGVTAGIKWPNDVLIDGRKVAGVLAEAVGGPATVRHVLLGIGVNVDQPAFPEPLAATATSLRLATGRPREPRTVLRPVLDRLSARYGEWLETGLVGLLDAWRRRSATIGTTVRTPSAGDGVAVDVGGDGALLVRLGDGTLARILSSAGDVAP
jgi:BirA family biotin operon repressor/biotin-[acetyl-CoA-carboxylase] ligase